MLSEPPHPASPCPQSLGKDTEVSTLAAMKEGGKKPTGPCFLRKSDRNGTSVASSSECSSQASQVAWNLMAHGQCSVSVMVL